MSDHAQHQHYFVPNPSHWMIFGSAALFFMATGAASWFNGGAWALSGADRLRDPGVHDGALVRRRHQRIRGRQVRPLGGHFISLGDELVHLLRSDVLRRILWSALLRAAARLARPRKPGQQAALAGLLSALAFRRAGLQGDRKS